MKKIIIMGLAQTGKTTIVKVTAEGMIPPKKAEYSATLDYKRKSYTLFGNKISMFDLGGQKSFLDRFIGDLAEFVFTSVTTLIFVIDVTNMDKVSLAKYYLDMGLKTLKKYSPSANTVIFLHKMDLIDKSMKDEFIESIKAFLELDDSFEIYETNIFDESIFKAMKDVVTGNETSINTLDGKVSSFQNSLNDFLDVIAIFDSNGKLVSSNNKEIKLEYQKLVEFDNTFGSIIDQKHKFSFSQLDTKMIFTSTLVRNFKLLLIYSVNNLSVLDSTYTKLINHSIRLVTDLNELII